MKVQTPLGLLSNKIRVNAALVGTPELCLPFVITNDEATCAELNELTSDEIIALFISLRGMNMSGGSICRF